MLKNELMGKSANNIKNGLMQKRNMDSKECTKVNKFLSARYIDLIRQQGIRNSTFERRVNSYGSDTEQQLKIVLNSSSADISKYLGEIFDEMKKDMIAADFDKDKRDEDISKSIEMFFEKSTKDLNRLLESCKVPVSKISELNQNMEHFCQKLKDDISNEVKTYANNSDNSLINLIQSEYQQFESQLLNNESVQKEPSNDFTNSLKQSVKTEEELAFEENNRKQENIPDKDKNIDQKDSDFEYK